MADLASTLKSGSVAPIYLVCSEEPLLVERTCAAVIEAALPQAARAFNLDVFEGRGLTADRLLSALQTLPMMAERRLVWVRDLVAMGAQELAGLVPYLAAPNPTSVWLGSAQKVDKRLKLFAAASKAGYLHQLSPPRNPTTWIRDEARARGIAIESGACARLADVIGSELARLAVSLDQLALFAGGQTITAEHVDDLIADTRERSVFELSEAIGAGDLQRALAAVAALFEQRQSAIGVVMMLARYVRQLSACHEGLAEGLSPSEMAAHVGVPPFVVDKLSQQARRFSPDALDRAVLLLSAADRGLKGQALMTRTLGRPLAERVIVDRLVARLIALSAGARSPAAGRRRRA